MRIKNKIFLIVIALLVSAVCAFALTSCVAEGSKVNEQTSATKKTVTVTVTDDKGENKEFTVVTDKAYVRGALEEIDLIQGEEGQYGLYVKYVDGIRADYELDGAYWSFYLNGEMTMTGIDSTPIKDGDKIGIVYTK